jgi:tRNA-specific 2-thiouridylase
MKRKIAKRQNQPLPSPFLRSRGEKRVLIALSGGIDSAVSAHLLIKQGYKVEAAFMKNWTSQEGLLKNECPWLEDRREALRVAGFLNIPLHTLDFEKQYQATVMKYFYNEYKAGRTPNPDVMCNKEIKFKLLYNWAMKNGFDYLATGHYGQVVSSKLVSGKQKKKNIYNSTTYSLQRSVDEFKDQTYFIYNIKTEQLPHVLFPIGGFKKDQVRKLAKKIGLPNAERKESMGLCFVGKIRLKDFLEQKLKPKKGKIILTSSSLRGGLSASESRRSNLSNTKIASPRSGHLGLAMSKVVIGYHEGLHNYTIGQRQGIKVGGNAGPYYVVSKDLKSNTLYVTNNPEDERLFVKEVQLHSVNWINKEKQLTINNTRLTGRYRHQGELVPLTISPLDKKHYQVIFKKPQKAVASGQSLVLYKGKECVGGGVIG